MKGVLLKINEVERIFIEDAAEMALNNAEVGEKPFYKLLLNKLSREEIHVDGMYMRLIEDSLYKKADRTNRDIVKSFCFKLAFSIRKQREEFQYDSINLGILDD